MVKDKREGWLKELRIASEVIVVGYGFGVTLKVQRIDRITPSGRLVIGGVYYNPKGREISGGRMLEPVSEKRLKQIEMVKMYRKLKETAWAEIDYRKMKKIIDILENKEDAKKDNK